MSYLHNFLIANPNLKEPFFKKSVIWLYQYTETGYSGVIINKPGPIVMGEICEEKGFVTWNNYDEPLRMGGPVRPSALMTIHSSEWQCYNTFPLTDEISLTSDNEMLTKISNGQEPYNWRFINGLCTWTPGQLEAEIKGTKPYSAENSWLVIDYDYEFMFTLDEEEQWEQGIELASSRMVDLYFN